MWKIFNTYKKRSESITWNRSSLLKALVDDLREAGIEADKNKAQIHVRASGHVWMEFDQHQHVDKNVLSFSVAMNLSPNGFKDSEAQTTWNALHLEDFYKLFTEQKHVPISIHKDEEYSSSRIKEIFKEYYIPLLKMMSDVKKCHSFLNGDSVDIGKKLISTSQFETPVFVNCLIAGYKYACVYNLTKEQELSLKKLHKYICDNPEAKQHIEFLRSIHNIDAEIGLGVQI